jgi:hypothetical protein
VDLHLDALYQRDARGFVSASRDPGLKPPHFHLVRTPIGNRWLLGASLNRAQRERVTAILSVEPLISDCADAETHPLDIDAIRAAIREHADPLREYRGPAFVFPDQINASTRAMLLVDLRQAPREGPFAWLGTAEENAHPIAIVRVGNGEVASVCYSARSTSAAAEAGVETAERYRRQGYGSMAALAWAAAVQQSGRVPLYSTSWENIASRLLAQRLGLTCYGEDLHLG